MPGGHRNPLRVSGLLEHVHELAAHARTAVSTSADRFAAAQGVDVRFVDADIKFIGASGIPRMDVVGTADPYFVAKLDDKLTFVSSVQVNTQTPVWNELWQLRNMPAHATLHVEVMDKDDGAITDDYIGKFQTSIAPGTKEVEIMGPLGRKRGSFWIKIDVAPAAMPEPAAHPYLFAGPVRFTRHFSPTVGLLTHLNDARLYSTWKLTLAQVPLFFPRDAAAPQHWNTAYAAAQKIFGPGATPRAVRASIMAGHAMLYARTTHNGFGVLDGPADILRLLHAGDARPPPGFAAPSPRLAPIQLSDDAHPAPPPLLSPSSPAAALASLPPASPAAISRTPSSSSSSGPGGPRFAHRVKPAVYTYVIALEDDTLRFSETGAAFFVDFASKHALHAACAVAVRYSGEFHPRPAGGWAAFDDATPDDAVAWELVVDNNSGTYAPDKALLPRLAALLEHNFPGFAVYALDREDPALVESREACRRYALEHRGVSREQLQPHASEGEVPLAHAAQKVAAASDQAATDGHGTSGEPPLGTQPLPAV